MKMALFTLRASLALGAFLTTFPAPAQEITSFHKAASAGDLATVTKLLHANPSLLNKKDQQGFSPLHLAAREGHAGVVSFLLDKGADLNATFKATGDTPLHIAAVNARTEVVLSLLQKWARLNAKNNAGETPLDRAATPQLADILREHEAKEKDALRATVARVCKAFDSAWWKAIEDGSMDAFLALKRHPENKSLSKLKLGRTISQEEGAADVFSIYLAHGQQPWLIKHAVNVDALQIAEGGLAQVVQALTMPVPPGQSAARAKEISIADIQAEPAFVGLGTLQAGPFTNEEANRLILVADLMLDLPTGKSVSVVRIKTTVKRASGTEYHVKRYDLKVLPTPTLTKENVFCLCWESMGPALASKGEEDVLRRSRTIAAALRRRLPEVVQKADPQVAALIQRLLADPRLDGSNFTMLKTTQGVRSLLPGACAAFDAAWKQAVEKGSPDEFLALERHPQNKKVSLLKLGGPINPGFQDWSVFDIYQEEGRKPWYRSSSGKSLEETTFEIVPGGIAEILAVFGDLPAKTSQLSLRHIAVEPHSICIGPVRTVVNRLFNKPNSPFGLLDVVLYIPGDFTPQITEIKIKAGALADREIQVENIP
jgi:hypothetical protein